MTDAPRDGNFVPTALFQVDGQARGNVAPGRIDQATGRVLVDNAGGSGTVTSVSVVTVNGFAGSVATATTTPAITLSTTITGLLKGNGTAISAAVANTDYQSPITLTTTGTSGAATFNGITLNIPNYATSGGLTVGTTTITSGTTTRVLFDNAGVLGEYTISGTGNVAMTTSAALTTPTVATSITPASNDGAALGTTALQWSDLFLASGGVINWNNGDTTITHSPSLLTANVQITARAIGVTGSTNPSNGMYLPAANTLGFSASNNGEVQLTSTAFSPITNDGNALGTTALSWADMFLATGGVINWNNGDATLTHSTGNLTSNVPLTANSFIPSSSSVPTNGIYLPAANTIGFAANSTGAVKLTSAVMSPVTDDGVALGTVGTAWGDLFLASGGIINWANNVAIGHATGIITVSTGELRITTPGTNSASVPTLGSTSTITNKRITRRLTTTNAPGATPTTNTDNVDIMNFTGLAAAITSMTTNLSGTPSDGDKLEFRFTDNGTARAITWGASFQSTTVTLPTTTVISTMLRVGFEWNATASKWDCIATC